MCYGWEPQWSRPGTQITQVVHRGQENKKLSGVFLGNCEIKLGGLFEKNDCLFLLSSWELLG